MHAISCASPSHVRIDNLCYDVVCWTVDSDGDAIPWIIRDGKPASFYSLPFHLSATIHLGTAAQAVADGRNA